MKVKIYLILLVGMLFASCSKDFLDKYPLDSLADNTYWTTEDNVRTYAYGNYSRYFVGYGSGYTWGSYFTGQSLNDDFAPTTPDTFTKNIPTSGGGWDFTYVRRANIFVNRVAKVPMSSEAIKHWTGVARFFRGMEYATKLVKRFGDVPWYSNALTENDTIQLYRPRDPRTMVMDSVLADFNYAVANVRASDGTSGLTVNKYVVLAFMSRIFLYEGTWQKYHGGDQAKATIYLNAAKDAASQIISSGLYAIVPDYRGLFTSLNLAGNKEMIMFRMYDTGLITHCLLSYNNTEAQTGVSKNAVDSYLCSDGLPISLSPLYKGDKGIANLRANRDPRFLISFVDSLRLNGIATNFSTTGIACRKYLNEAERTLLSGTGNLNITDAPVIRYGEVLMNYAEACAELGTLTQNDLDISINKIRDRGGVAMTHLQIIGGQPAVNGVVYDDPKRDQTVPSMIWEIRRERRIELMMEGFRLDDLKRWGKINYTDTQLNPDINLGAWINKADYASSLSVYLQGNGTQGYLFPAWKPEVQRTNIDPKVYLDPLPVDQITLYKAHGVTLTQNPGW